MLTRKRFDPMAATYEIPSIQQGDTFVARNIATVTQSAAAVAISSAVMKIITAAGVTVATWDTADSTATITGAGSNVIHINEISDSVTAEWPLGKHDFALKVRLTASSDKITLLKGSITILK